MVVPDSSIRWVCLRPSEPVIPWTITRESEFRKIAISITPSARGQLGCPAGSTVHRVDLFESRQAGVTQYPAPHVGVVAVKPYHQWHVNVLVAAGQQFKSLHDPVGDGVTGGDPAEDIDEHALHLIVADDDLQAVRQLPRHRWWCQCRGDGERDDVERAHHQAGTVTDDAHRAV